MKNCSRNRVLNVLAAGTIAFAISACSQEDADLAITGVNVIDVVSGEVLPNQTILIEGERIAAVRPSKPSDANTFAHRIDGVGKYAIPGLWDMHVHMANAEPLVDWDFDVPAPDDDNQRQTYEPAWVAFGITGAREMSGGALSVTMRDRINSGELNGPRLIIGSPILDGPFPIWPGDGVVAVNDADDARAKVRQYQSEGYDFLKPYTLLSPESYRALMAEAGKLDMAVAGELPISVSAWEAAELGQRSIEHLTGIEIACSSREEDLRAAYASGVAAFSEDTEQLEKVRLWNRGEWEAVDSFDAGKCDRLYAHLREHGVWVTPTLVIQRRISYPESPAVADNPFLKYVTKNSADVSGVIETFDPDRKLVPTYDHRFATLKALYDSGVGVLAGSDEQGGFRLHEELQIFVDAGLTPLEALRTATINPARFLGREAELGSIATSKFADLVLLGSNPLEDIANTLDIDSVILNGRVFDRKALDLMLAQVEADARKWESGD